MEPPVSHKPKTFLLSVAIAAALAGCQQQDAAPATDGDQAAPATTAAELPPTAAFALADLDTSKDACEDLDAFVNGKWLAAHPVPSDRTTWGSFEMLDERSEVASRNIAEDAKREKLEEKRPDPLLRESAAILADALTLLNGDQKLSQQVLPASRTMGHWSE